MLEFLTNPYFLGIAALCGIAGFIIQAAQILSRKLRTSDSHSPSSFNKRVLSSNVPVRDKVPTKYQVNYFSPQSMRRTERKEKQKNIPSTVFFLPPSSL